MFLSAPQHNPLAFQTKPTPIVVRSDITQAFGSTTNTTNRTTNDTHTVPSNGVSIFAWCISQGDGAHNTTAVCRMQASSGQLFTRLFGGDRNLTNPTPEMDCQGGYLLNDINPAYINDTNPLYFAWATNPSQQTTKRNRAISIVFDRNVNMVQHKTYIGPKFASNMTSETQDLNVTGASFDSATTEGNLVVVIPHIHFETNVSNCNVDLISITTTGFHDSTWTMEGGTSATTVDKVAYGETNTDNGGGSESVYMSSCFAIGWAAADGSTMSIDVDVDLDFGTGSNLANRQGFIEMEMIEFEAA